MNRSLEPVGNPWEVKNRALKAIRLALILHEAGLRRAGEVHAMGPEQRALALRILAAGLGPDGARTGRGGRAPEATASAGTWRAVASLVGWLGGGSGGRRHLSYGPEPARGSRTAPSRIGVCYHRDHCGATESNPCSARTYRK